MEKAALQKIATFTRKHLCRSHFLKVGGMKARNFIEKRLQNRCFSVKIANTYFEKHQRTASSVDSFTTFHL